MSYEQISSQQCVAKKDHRCIWCPEMIRKGDTYRREVSKYDGDFQYQAWHLECAAVAEEAWRQGDDGEFMPHSFQRGTTREA